MGDPGILDPKLQYGAMGLLAVVIVAFVYFAGILIKAVSASLTKHAEAAESIKSLPQQLNTLPDRIAQAIEIKALERHAALELKIADRHAIMKEHVSETAKETRHSIRDALQSITSEE